MNDVIKKSPYKGLLVTCIFLIGIPIGLFFMFKSVIFSSQTKYSDDLNLYTSLFLGFGTGFIFQMSCAILGLFKGSLKVVIKRIFNFFSNLTISLRFAFLSYLDDIKENGVVFWIIFPIVLITLGIAIYGLLGYIECYQLL